MKKLSFIPVLIMILAFFWNCGDDELTATGKLLKMASDTIEVAYGDTVYAPGGYDRITFDSLLQESRCPTGVVCVWEGNGSIQMSLLTESKKVSFILNTHPDFTNDTTTVGYYISLVELNPYPHIDSTYTEKDYRAVILVRTEI
ncbi:MAG: hypothetical protein AB7W47_15975 [Calditrichaceae bacterium]